MADLKSLAEQLVNLTVKEVNELAEILKNDYGIVPAATAVTVAAGAQVAEKAEQSQPQEKTEFDVVLKSAGQAKLAVIKLIKEITGLGLQESKKLVDGAPVPVKKAIPKAEAESIKSKLAEVGAEAEVV